MRCHMIGQERATTYPQHEILFPVRNDNKLGRSITQSVAEDAS